MKVTKSTSHFTRFAKWTSHVSGSPLAFGLALGTIAVWAVSGPIFGFSDTWQLVINTGTTVVTFLMVFLIQNTQNRDAQAIQVKLDELIRCTNGAHNALLNLEELEEDELRAYCAEYVKIAERARDALRHGKSDTGTPEVHASRRNAKHR
jgi:low affinity Fe/Cu permease